MYGPPVKFDVVFAPAFGAGVELVLLPPLTGRIESPAPATFVGPQL